MNKFISICLMLTAAVFAFGRESALLDLQLLSEKIKEYETMDAKPVVLGTILRPPGDLVSIVWKRIPVKGDQKFSLADAMLTAERRTAELLPESHQAKREHMVIALAMHDCWLLAYKIEGLPLLAGVQLEASVLYVPVYYNGECSLDLMPFTPPKKPSSG